MVKVLLVLLCLVLPFVAVPIKKGPCLQVLWTFLLQLLGYIPGVIYGIYRSSRTERRGREASLFVVTV
jgi:uncharacterized membrane protein YqaE (UPF0057 family)